MIAPVAHTGATAWTKYQLLLPQWLINDKYIHSYQKRRLEGSYMILDNGAAEGKAFDQSNLHLLARSMMVHEIVVPDILGMAGPTLDLLEDFIPHMHPAFRYMGVVQGSSEEELLGCASRMVHSFGDQLHTLAVPRHVLTLAGDLRANLVSHLRHGLDWEKDIHLLGMHPSYPLELADYGGFYREMNVRGIDTSAPFCQAIANQFMFDGIPAERPWNYFDYEFKSIGSENSKFRQNIISMKHWVRGDKD